MVSNFTKTGVLCMCVALICCVYGAVVPQNITRTEPGMCPPHGLKVVTLNTRAYGVKPSAVDKRFVSLVAQEDMHVVALEHFIGVGKGSLSDNGHILSLKPENPWVAWEKAATGMEPTGTKGYFGYCGRDYYSEVSGVGDIMAYESFPAGTHILIPKGGTLYMHCYAHNFSSERPGYFHHMVRVLYW